MSGAVFEMIGSVQADLFLLGGHHGEIGGRLYNPRTPINSLSDAEFTGFYERVKKYYKIRIYSSGTLYVGVRSLERESSTISYGRQTCI